jgi:L-ascorbate metabolism protein UlaG (beta-lactamase superfamily)
VPVGGGNTLYAARAAEVISLLEPKVVIPMYYRHPGLTGELAGILDPVDKFLRELGVSEPETQDSLKVTRASLTAEDTQVVLLQPSTS